MQLTRRLWICLVVCAAIAAFSAPSSASLSEGERMLETNRFKEAIRLLAEAAEPDAGDDAERARALRGLAVGHLALEEGVEALGACAEAIPGT